MNNESLIERLEKVSYHKTGSNTRGLDLDEVISIIRQHEKVASIDWATPESSDSRGSLPNKTNEATAGAADTLIDLKPCPFCGASAQPCSHCDDEMVECSNKHCDNSCCYDLEKWNTRVNASEIPVTVDERREYQDALEKSGRHLASVLNQYQMLVQRGYYLSEPKRESVKAKDIVEIDAELLDSIRQDYIDALTVINMGNLRPEDKVRVENISVRLGQIDLATLPRKPGIEGGSS